MHKVPWDLPQRPVLPPKSWQQVTEPDFCGWTNPATRPPTCSPVMPNSCHRPCSPPRARAQPRAGPAQQGAALQASSVLLPTGNRCRGSSQPLLPTCCSARLLQTAHQPRPHRRGKGKNRLRSGCCLGTFCVPGPGWRLVVVASAVTQHSESWERSRHSTENTPIHIHKVGIAPRRMLTVVE